MALALLFYGGIAGGVLITGLAGQSAATLNTYLFGSITTISWADVWVTVALAAVVVVVALGLSPQLFAVAQDQEFAQVAGLNVRLYNLLVSVMAAVTVTVAMRTVGLLLVSALMVVPVATAQQLTRGFRTTLLAAMGLGMLASLGGVRRLGVPSTSPPARRSCCSRWPASLAAYPVGVLAAAPPAARASRSPSRTTRIPLRRRPHRRTARTTRTQHGDDCGHPAVPHGDHVDYVHDGHRHAVPREPL